MRYWIKGETVPMRWFNALETALKIARLLTAKGEVGIRVGAE
jgi:hypothetical protein